jgi:NitT/TauT family transport system substrate-binding protein
MAPSELVVVDFEGTAMLKDGLFTTTEWLGRPRHRDVAARFLRASLRGWTLCRDRPEECVDITLAQSPASAARIKPG